MASGAERLSDVTGLLMRVCQTASPPSWLQASGRQTDRRIAQHRTPYRHLHIVNVFSDLDCRPPHAVCICGGMSGSNVACGSAGHAGEEASSACYPTSDTDIEM